MLRPSIFASLCLLLVPAAASSGTLEAGPVVIVLDNGHAEDCLEDATGVCPASVSGTSLGNMEVDARQRFRYVGIGFQDSARRDVNHAAGYPLLPDGSLVYVDARTLTIPNPAFALLAENAHEITGPGPLSTFGLFFGNDRYGFSYYGPDLASREASIGPQEWDQSFYESGTNYGGVEGLYDQGQNSLDNQTTNTLVYPCHAAPDAETCAVQQRMLVAALSEGLPNVVYGSAIEQIEAAGSMNGSNFEEAGEDRAFIGYPIGRGAPQTVPRPALAQAPVVAPPLTSIGWSPGPDLDLRATPRDVVAPSPPATLQTPGDDAHFSLPETIIVCVLGTGLAIIIAILYSRIKGNAERVLSPTRSRLLDLLAQRGPMNYSAIARSVGLDRKTIEHHTRVLARERRIAIYDNHREVLIALPGQPQPPERPRSEGSAACGSLLAALKAAGGSIARKEIDRHLPSIPRRTRNHALRQLELDGFVHQVLSPEGPVIMLDVGVQRSAVASSAGA